MFLLLSSSVIAFPATLSAAITKSKAGDSIELAAGDYGTIILPRRSGRGTVTVNASKARFSAIVVRNVEGIEIRGGTIAGSREQVSAVLIDSSTRVRVSEMSISGARVGVSIARSTNVDVVDNWFNGVRSDGVHIAMSQHVRVIGNTCKNFDPVLSVYDVKGKLLTDGDHPDCIQGWSRKGYSPTADVLIENNRAIGFMQGVWFGDVGQGGYDRITVRNNYLNLSVWHGISVYEGRGTVITGNTVRTIPGAKAKSFPFQPIKTWIYTVGGSGETICGNEVPAMPDGLGTKRCPR